VIQINGLNKSLFGGGHKVNILNGIDLVIPSGQFVAITGASGSGKTTLLSLIAGLDEPTGGNIVINDQDITKLNEDELAELRSQHFGFIFQNFNLIPTLTALENVTLSAELNGTNGSQKKSMELLDLVGLINRIHHYPTQLSGGEQQRLCLASAMVDFLLQCRSIIRSRIRLLFCESRFPVGSSASTILGSLIKALARQSRCCSPPESCVG